MDIINNIKFSMSVLKVEHDKMIKKKLMIFRSALKIAVIEKEYIVDKSRLTSFD